MTGLAAAFGVDVLNSAAARSAAVAIADALTPRGPAVASWQAGGAHLAVRGVRPAVPQIPGGAMVLDGEVVPSTLAAAYATGGATALVGGGEPYAVILADLSRDRLVLARNGAGPPLYWARHGPALLAASEPAGLLAGGVPAAPDPAVVKLFLDTGQCDDTAATFFAGINRVMPGQVVEVSRRGAGWTGCEVRAHEPAPPPVPTARAALAAVDLSGRVGLRLGCGLGPAALLGAALAAPERPRPLPVYSTTFPELGGDDRGAYCAAALLGPHALGATRHRALAVSADELDIDAYLADLGEPTPALADWLRWAIARRVAGEVDALLDAGVGPHLNRLADRVVSRYGVGLRLPLREVSELTGRAALATEVYRTLPAATSAPALAASERAGDRLLAELLCRLRVELVTTFLEPRAAAYLAASAGGSGSGRRNRRAGPSGRDGLAETLALLAGGRVDAAALWRHYQVERWLRQFSPDPGKATGWWSPTEGAGSSLRASAGPPPRMVAGGREWQRRPIRTELLTRGDKLPETVAWHVAEQWSPASVTSPWYVLLAAKPAAVTQGRARELWQIRPRLTARLLHRLTGYRYGPATPWAMQVALEEGGWWRVVAAIGAASLGRLDWYTRLAGPAVRALRPPRPHALPPGQVAVVPVPAGPDQLATELVAALRTTLPEPTFAAFGGCAVVAGEVLGWAARPGADPPAPGLLTALADGDPFGDNQTPLVVVFPATGAD